MTEIKYNKDQLEFIRQEEIRQIYFHLPKEDIIVLLNTVLLQCELFHKQSLSFCICGVIGAIGYTPQSAKFTSHQQKLLSDFVYCHKPSKDLFPDFYDEEHEKTDKIGLWWPRNHSNKRIEYLKALIAHLTYLPHKYNFSQNNVLE